MNTIKLITFFLTVSVALAALLLTIQLLLRPLRSRRNAGDRLSLTYGLWFAFLFLSGASMLTQVIAVTGEAINVLAVKVPAGLAWELIKTIGMLLVIGLAWFLSWFYVVKYLLNMLLPDFEEHKEMEDNGVSYFIIRGTVLLGIMLSLSSLLVDLLRFCLPGLDVPFYH